jgi:HEPN domain-containing protein
MGHGIGDLCDEVRRVAGVAAGELCEELVALDIYYIPTRYPDALPSGVPAEAFSMRHAEAAIELASKTLDLAHSLVDEG